MEKKNLGLARYLARSLANPSLQLAADQWFAVHADPLTALKHPYFRQDTTLTRELVVYAMARLASTNFDRAEQMWRRVGKDFAFSPLEKGRIERALAVAAGREDHPARIAVLDRVPKEAVDDAVEKYRIREGLKTGAWAQLARWTESKPVGETNELRWRYWHARSLEQIGRGADAALIFEELARLRDYYGFLSADRLGLDYEMNHHPVAPTGIEIAGIETRPGIVRARELLSVDLPYLARREWQHEIGDLSKRELEVAAYVVHQWGWYDQAILALGKAESYDDLDIRFPLRHEQLVRDYAKKRALQPAVLYSIIRTESAFMVDARSPAGALGLMQVMPATGRETAQRIGTRLASAQGLLEPAKNIMIGSAYLQQVLARFQGSFSMAAAAYNAGPHRVKSWLPKSGCLPADIWVDTIPFTETRRYVRRASFYATVYQWRLQENIARLQTRLSDVNAQGKSELC
jgi:soluble lytic murein transglycosylase